MTILRNKISSRVLAILLVVTILLSMVPICTMSVFAQTSVNNNGLHADVFSITVKNTDGVEISGATLTGTYGSISINETTDATGTSTIPSITKYIQENSVNHELILSATAPGYTPITQQSFGQYGAAVGDEYAYVDVSMTKANSGTPGGSGIEQTTFAFRTPSPENIKYGMTFANSALGGKGNGALTYEVTGNNSIASVDAKGTVKILAKPGDATVFPATITVSATKAADGQYNAATISYTLTIERDQVTAADFTVNKSAIEPTNKWYNASSVSSHGNKLTVRPGNGYSQISKDGEKWDTVLEFTNEGKDIALGFYLKKANGTTTSLWEQTINFDKTGPEQVAITTSSVSTGASGFSFLVDVWNTITFGKFVKDEQYLGITATDSVSGVEKIEYYRDNDDRNYTRQQAESLPYSEYKDTDMISYQGLVNMKVVIYAKITDVAGNVSYFRSNGMGFDSLMEIAKHPEINISLKNTRIGDAYYDDVPFSISITNPEATEASNPNKMADGIKRVTTTISAPGKQKVIVATRKNEKEPPSNLRFNSEDLASETHYTTQTTQTTLQEAYVVEQSFNSKNITITVVVEDVFSDNKYEKTVTLAVHNAPEITVTYDHNNFSNGKYLGDGLNRKATIDILDLGFQNSEVAITVKKDGKDLNVFPAFDPIAGATDDNNDQIGYRMSIDYAQFGDGDYYFDIGYNTPAKELIKKVDYLDSVNPQEFTIDNTGPVINVTYQNSEKADPSNGNYFRGIRTATIQVTERNWRSSDFLINLTGENNSGGSYEPINVPTLSSWTSNGDEHTAVIVFQEEGRYTFSGEYADLAWNQARPLEEQVFFIDRTDPIVPKTLADISIESFVNGADSRVAPQFTVSDNNYDQNSVVITLTGSMHGGIILDGSWSYSSDGRSGTYTFPNFENVKIKDDIYTLNVKVTDKSGRVSQSGPLEFSVNRFGSTFDMKGVQGVNKGYFKAIQDIVIREINPNKIDPDAYSITLSRNGSIKELVPDNEYKRESVEESGQWSEYAYTVKSVNFADDGKYVVTIKDRDLAKNENSSDNIEQIGELVSFAIDNTLPTVAISGLEDNEIYSEKTQLVTIAITDNIKTDQVLIKLNGEIVTGTLIEDIDTSYKTQLTVPSSFNRQTLELTYTDAAGNSNATIVKDFLINANAFVRFYQNKPLFYSSIGAGTAILLGLAVFLILRKKKTPLKRGTVKGISHS